MRRVARDLKFRKAISIQSLRSKADRCRHSCARLDSRLRARCRAATVPRMLSRMAGARIRAQTGGFPAPARYRQPRTGGWPAFRSLLALGWL
jgi:hypothetical protein